MSYLERLRRIYRFNQFVIKSRPFSFFGTVCFIYIMIYSLNTFHKTNGYIILAYENQLQSLKQLNTISHIYSKDLLNNIKTLNKQIINNQKLKDVEIENIKKTINQEWNRYFDFKQNLRSSSQEEVLLIKLKVRIANADSFIASLLDIVKEENDMGLNSFSFQLLYLSIESVVDAISNLSDFYYNELSSQYNNVQIAYEKNNFLIQILSIISTACFVIEYLLLQLNKIDHNTVKMKKDRRLVKEVSFVDSQTKRNLIMQWDTSPDSIEKIRNNGGMKKLGG